MVNKTKKKKITAMIVDDYSKMRIIVKKMLLSILAEEITTIYECSDGKEAIDKFAKYKPDWILMDLKMKSVDGLTASKEILNMNHDAKIIILTQFNDEEYYSVAKELGIKAFVLKENILDVPSLIKNSLQKYLKKPTLSQGEQSEKKIQ